MRAERLQAVREAVLGEGEAASSGSMLPALAAGVLGPGAEVAKGRVRGPSVTERRREEEAAEMAAEHCPPRPSRREPAVDARAGAARHERWRGARQRR